MAIKKVNNALKETANKNVSSVLKKGKEVIKEKKSTPLDHSLKHQVTETCNDRFEKVVGIAKGVTKNMGNYESLRVDVWLTDTVKGDETQEQALERISIIIDEQLDIEVSRIVGN